MTEQEIAVSMVSIDFDKTPKMTVNELSKSFPQIFRRDGSVKRSTLRKKYGLREAMQTVQQVHQCIKTMNELKEQPLIRVFTRNGTLIIEGQAASFMCNNMTDVWVDMIEQGWEFRVC